MTPIVFGECRGWFHPASGGTPKDCGVVLCSPFGYEALCTYRGWRALAERLAAAGMPVLRFDYPSTGDSAGDDALERVPAWLNSIEAGTAWLRRHAGVSQIALCGLRLGALLAAKSAARRPGSIDALILLAPVTSGRMYLREITLAAATGTDTAQDADWLDSVGFRLHASDVAALRELDIARALAQSGTSRLLVAETPQRPAFNAATLAKLDAGGLAVERLAFTDQDAYFRHAHLSLTPDAVFAQVVDWTAAGVPSGCPSVPPAAPDLLACEGPAAERVLRFGQEGQLVGVLCEPSMPPQPVDRTAVLILNTGANHHIGNSRLAVRMARKLAASGTISLRIDLSGIGDSDETVAWTHADRSTQLFDDAALGDVYAALDALEQRGFHQCFVIGVCSGAHHAFQAALRDPRIVGLALANLPAFDRQAGGAPALDGGPPPGEIPALRRPRMAMRRLRAETDRFIAERLGLELGLDRAGQWLRMLHSRGTSVLLAYSAGDRALRELRAHFGRGGRYLPRHGVAISKVLNGRDHSLNARAMQMEFIGMIEAHLRLHHGLTPEAAGRPGEVAPVPTVRRFGLGLPRPSLALQRSGQSPMVTPRLHRGGLRQSIQFQDIAP